MAHNIIMSVYCVILETCPIVEMFEIAKNILKSHRELSDKYKHWNLFKAKMVFIRSVKFNNGFIYFLFVKVIVLATCVM